MFNTIYNEFNSQKIKVAEKNRHKDEKVLHKSIHGKTIENLRNRINLKLVNNGKDYLNQSQAICHTKYLQKYSGNT